MAAVHLLLGQLLALQGSQCTCMDPAEHAWKSLCLVHPQSKIGVWAPACCCRQLEMASKSPYGKEPLPAGGHLLIASEVELAEKAPEAGVKEEEGAATPGPAKVAKPDGASTPGAAKQVVMQLKTAVRGHSAA